MPRVKTSYRHGQRLVNILIFGSHLDQPSHNIRNSIYRAIHSWTLEFFNENARFFRHRVINKVKENNSFNMGEGNLCIWYGDRHFRTGWLRKYYQTQLQKVHSFEVAPAHVMQLALYTSLLKPAKVVWLYDATNGNAPIKCEASHYLQAHMSYVETFEQFELALACNSLPIVKRGFDSKFEYVSEGQLGTQFEGRKDFRKLTGALRENLGLRVQLFDQYNERLCWKFPAMRRQKFLFHSALFDFLSEKVKISSCNLRKVCYNGI